MQIVKLSQRSKNHTIIQLFVQSHMALTTWKTATAKYMTAGC